MNTVVAETPHELKPSRRKRVGCAVLVILSVILCLGSITVTVLADQTTLMGAAYLQAVHLGNANAAELLGDHFSDDKTWHQKFYAQDIQRDIGYLSNAELTGVTATREQTLSGQWVTMVRFSWRERGSSGAWTQAALRVKTDHWWFITYIRAVEVVEP
jgi:hypothetical protein